MNEQISSPIENKFKIANFLLRKTQSYGIFKHPQKKGRLNFVDKHAQIA